MPLGVYATTGYGHWYNAQLTKDCGTIPYLLHKVYGYDAVLFGQKNGDYPNQTYVPGVRLDFLPPGKNHVALQCQYIADHYSEMDVLLLLGAYRTYIPILDEYRRRRPDGKVYLALDANSLWMEAIDWDHPEFRRMLSAADVIATSCRAMQRYLNRKWPCLVHYIPNGFYNYGNVDMTVDFSRKENTILSVGRVGSQQKNTRLLLEGFALVAKKIPAWKLKIIGAIEPSFREEIFQFFARCPFLARRVTFTGAILDRAALMDEYKRAKIFALTSTAEGGTPNVVAEALFGGCYMVTSAIDAAADVTDDGRCGEVFAADADFPPLLLRAARDEARLLAGAKNALAYAKQTFDFQKIIRVIHYLLFGRA